MQKRWRGIRGSNGAQLFSFKSVRIERAKQDFVVGGHRIKKKTLPNRVDK